MSEFPTGSQIATLSDMIRAERAVQDVTNAQLNIWVTRFLNKMRQDSIAGIAPDTTLLEYLKEEWDHDHAPEILAVAVLAYRKRYKRKRKMYSDAGEQKFSAETRQTLSLVPDRTFQVTVEAINQGVKSGATLEAILDKISADVLASVALTSERTGRLVGPTAINSATLASYSDAQNLDGEGPYVKSWVSVHDLHVRPTHVDADASEENHRIPLNKQFIVGGFLADIPRDFDLPIWESAGCRCIADVESA